ncbi:hypothetical protein SUGI_0708190 [Cryptomeria japonica]|nr:hypothetical protein SUGI_0708190 [Cryptomeria japonica]
MVGRGRFGTTEDGGSKDIITGSGVLRLGHGRERKIDIWKLLREGMVLFVEGGSGKEISGGLLPYIQAHMLILKRLRRSSGGPNKQVQNHRQKGM